MTFNEYTIIARAAGIEIDIEKEHLGRKIVNVYHLYCEGKRGQKFISLTDPDSQMSKETENDLFKFFIKIQDQDL